MEMNVFRTIGYDLGIPLSYRFLRRYARVSVPITPDACGKCNRLPSVASFNFCSFSPVCQGGDARAHAGALHFGILTHELRFDKSQRFQNSIGLLVHGTTDE